MAKAIPVRSPSCGTTEDHMINIVRSTTDLQKLGYISSSWQTQYAFNCWQHIFFNLKNKTLHLIAGFNNIEQILTNQNVRITYNSSGTTILFDVPDRQAT
jgi:hypothetical protein